jgi:3-deoxy-D-manno-octulosonate 8-phosphate phosphatase (KDO 8-P phosphatase)
LPSKRTSSASFSQRLKAIKLVILDVDGVLTDGKIIYGSDGTEYKNFDAHDGYGITRALALGLQFASISGSNSPVTNMRMEKLGIKEAIQNRMDKLEVYRELREKYHLKDSEVCFMGDDDFDIPLLNEVGLSAAPGDAMATVRRTVDYVAKNNGGRGAVREVIDMILKAKKLI